MGNLTPFPTDKPRRPRKPKAEPRDPIRSDVVDEAEREARAAIAKLDGAKPGAGETDQEPVAVDDATGPALAIHVPLGLIVVLVCPSCGDTVTTTAKLSARVTKDSDGSGALALRTRAAKVSHVCGQLVLPIDAAPVVEGPRSR